MNRYERFKRLNSMVEEQLAPPAEDMIVVCSSKHPNYKHEDTPDHYLREIEIKKAEHSQLYGKQPYAVLVEWRVIKMIIDHLNKMMNGALVPIEKNKQDIVTIRGLMVFACNNTGKHEKFATIEDLEKYDAYCAKLKEREE